jgi:hypothetical protein
MENGNRMMQGSQTTERQLHSITDHPWRASQLTILYWRVFRLSSPMKPNDVDPYVPALIDVSEGHSLPFEMLSFCHCWSDDRYDGIAAAAYINRTRSAIKALCLPEPYFAAKQGLVQSQILKHKNDIFSERHRGKCPAMQSPFPTDHIPGTAMDYQRVPPLVTGSKRTE